MPSLGQRLVAEWLGSAFLLAAVVGSGIMAQKLAGGNAALALLCNTLPTGAILVVLILIFGPLSGAHFNPAVTLAFASRGELPWAIAGLYIVVQIAGGIAGVWTAHLMFELPLWQIVAHGAHRCRTMACRGRGNLRPAAHDFRLRGPRTRRGRLRRRPLYHLGLLVHRVDVVRQSRGDHRACAVGYVCRHCAGRGPALHRSAVAGGRAGRDTVGLAVAKARLAAVNRGVRALNISRRAVL